MQTPTDDDHAFPHLGLVISYFGNKVAIEAADGSVFQCYLHRNQPLPVVGDHVRWHIEGNEHRIIAIENRHSLLEKGKGEHGKKKPLAANVDVIVIVMAPPPIFSEYLIDRYLAAAALLQLSAIVVLNKADLLVDHSAKQEAMARLQAYQAIDYPVFLSSIFYGDSIAQLSHHLQHQTAVFMGPSGVGKSSLISVLSHTDIRVGETSAKGAGKHTTTFTQLYHLSGGGHVIDSPGVREFNLWPLTQQEVMGAFKEIAIFSDCQFRNCLHLAEPGCAVQTAVKSGKISPQRYHSYQTLMKTAEQNLSFKIRKNKI